MEKYLPLNKILTKYCTIILLLVALFSSSLSYAQCPTGGNLYISNQTQIDNFSTNYPGCTAITGWVYISESVPGNITNLNGLSAITSIGESLYFVDNTALTSLSGLDNITSIGSYLAFLNNDALTSFAGLENITSLGAELYISDNAALTSLNGLDNLASIAGFFYLGNNSTLASISALNTLASIGNDYLSINNNPMLTSLDGLNNIDPTTITSLFLQNNSLLSTCEVASICSYLGVPANPATISGNVDCACNSRSEIESACTPSCPPGGSITLTTQTDIDNFSCNFVGCTALTGNLTIDESVAGNITNLNGLTALTSVGGDLIITTNTALTDLSGLDNITSIGSRLYINNNTALTNLSGLNNLASLGWYLFITDNSTLSSLSALSNLTSINGLLLVRDCPALANLSGLHNITSIASYLRIQNNATLENLNGLANVTSIGGYLTIDNNDALTSLSGLDNVASIGGVLTISNNAMITSLSSLVNIAPAGITNLILQNNSVLSTCEVTNICSYLGVSANTATITGNATGCSSRVEVENACQTIYTTIPDVNFEQKLIDLGIDSEGGPTDGQILTADAEAQTSFLLLTGSSISDLTGIEAFVNITQLFLNSNQLSSLDVSQNTALTSLDCSFNQLTSVSLNTALTYLNCQSNQLTSLDVSLNTMLTGLDVSYNLLSSLNVRNGNNTNLYLSANNNSLSCITVDDPAWSTTNWTNIDPGVVFELNCGYTAIPDANFEQKLINLGIDTEGAPTDGWILTTDAEAVTSLNVNTSNISDLTGIEAFIGLNYLNCHSNQLTSLDVSQNIALHTLYCQSNQLTSLDVSLNTALIYFICSSNQLTSLDVSLNTALKDLRCNSNQLTSLDIRNGNNTNFTYFNATSNSLTCISVDDPAYTTANWTNIDAGVVFSPGCDTYTAIPDANFEQKLIDLGIDSDGAPTDGWILTADAEAKSGTLNVSNAGISDLTGIEAFINLGRFYCESNQLTNLDVSQIAGLTGLWCKSNQLTSLDVSQNTALTDLYCESNQLTSLDVSQNIALKNLYCESNQLTSLDLSQNNALTDLNCNSNQLTSLNVNLNTALIDLRCRSNQLTSLDLSQNTVLEHLYCWSNQLTNLDVSLNTALVSLYCKSNHLASLDVSLNTALKNLFCQSNLLTSLDLSFNTALINLGCWSNQLTNLDVRNGNYTNFNIFNATENSLTCITVDDPAYSTANWTNIDAGVGFTPDCDIYTAIPDVNFEQKLIDLGIDSEGGSTNGAILTADAEAQAGTLDVSVTSISDLAGIEAFINITQLNCYSNQLTNLDLSQNTALVILECSYNQLTNLDVSQNTALTFLSCSSNQLSSLDVSQNTALIQLRCESNQLSNLDVSQNTALTYLRCSSNQLSNLNVNQNTALTTLSCSSNPLTSLDVSQNTALTYLRCNSNQLTNLNVSQNTALTYLECNSNQLSNLDISQNTALVYLYCESNQLSNLDVSQNTALVYLYCKSNQLSNLNVSQNAALILLDCYSNQLTSLDVSQCTALKHLYCWSNQLTSLDVSQNTALIHLYCYSNQLTSLDVRNGNNTNFSALWANSNSLSCISVDDPTYSTANWTDIDAGVVFEFNCGYTAIPDVNFEQKLIDLGIDTEGAPTDGWILTTDAEAKTGTLVVSLAGISDLTGIEAFINITQLFCHYNQLTSLDVSHNTALTDLNCHTNQLSSLDVRNGNNTNFTTFNVTSNSLTCISVDDPTWSTANWTNIDSGTYFGSDCLCPSPAWSVPSASSTSITSDASCVDADGWTHYYNSSSEELLLSLKIGTSGAVIPDNAISLDPSGVTDVFWVPGVAGNFVSNSDGAAFMKRKWNVVPTTQPTSPVGVRFYYTTEEYDAVNTEISNQGGTALTGHTQMRFFKILNGSDPFNIGSLLATDGIDLGHGNSSTTEWTYNGFGSDHYAEYYVDGFSGGGGGGASGGAALPIELLYFRGEALDQSNQITWATASEENTELHLIEYSNGIDDWKVIGQREAAGFSSQTIYYEFSDHSPSTIGYYRLKSVDFDGAFQVSNTIAIERESNHFELLNVYPIPTESNLGINFNLANKSLITVTLTDLSGRMVTVQRHDGTAGVNRINLDLSQLNAGMYLVQIDNGREKLQRRIVKQ